MEPNTIAGIELHFRHLISIMGQGDLIKQLDQTVLQHFASKCSLMKYRCRPTSPATVEKKLVTLRTAWNWTVGTGLVTARFPALRHGHLKKPDEQPLFQTREEIERRIKRGGMSEGAIHDRWESLLLQLPEVEIVLAHVKEHAAFAWVHPLFCFAAHTGALRSEIIRPQVDDVDFDAKTVFIREKKREHDTCS